MKELNKSELRSWFQDFATTVLLSLGEAGEFAEMTEAEQQEVERLKTHFVKRIGFGNAQHLDKANQKLDARPADATFPFP